MSQIALMDCTLGDGGRSNGRHFGKLAAKILHDSIDAGSEYVEVGAMVCAEYDPDTTAFNALMQANGLITPRPDHTLYGVSVESADFSLIKRIPKRTADGIDYIRVVFAKEDLPAALECCRNIVENGYKVAVHPLRVINYTDTEIQECIARFVPLSPMAFFIDDSFGAFSADVLSKYLRIFDGALAAQTAIGFYGRNYFLRQTELLQAAEQFSCEREVIVSATAARGIDKIDCSLECETVSQFANDFQQKKYDVSRYIHIADYLECETVSQFANDFQQKKYDVSRYMHIADYLEAKQETPMPVQKADRYYLTAHVNCDPLWAFYSERSKYSLSDEEFRLFVAQLPDVEKHEATEELYEQSVSKWMQRRWNKKLAVIVPTANRSQSIAYYLKKVGRAHEFFGIDLILYDSSSDDKTKQVVDDFTKGECRHIVYERYTGIFDGVTIDHKGITAYDVFSKRYEYVWMTRDGWIIDITNIYSKIYELIMKEPDAVVLYSPGEDEDGLGHKEYTSGVDLFKDSCCRMSILGTVLLSSEFLRCVLENQPLVEDITYGMWQPIAMFHQWAQQPAYVISETINFYQGNICATETSFWNKNGRALWQIAENWYKLITNLPDIYDVHKPHILKLRHAVFTPFGIRQLIIMRTTNSLTLKKVKNNAKYLVHVTNCPLKRIYAVCLIPKLLCRFMLSPKLGVGSFLMRFARIYSTVKHLYKLPPVLPPRYDIAALDTGEKTNDIVFENNGLCMLIFTHGHADELKDNLDITLKQYAQYNMDVIVFDSSETDEVKHLVVDGYAKEYANIRYERYNGTQDPRSIDRKLIEAYERFSAEYKYVWIMRHRTLTDMNACAFKVFKAMEQNADIIVFSGNDRVLAEECDCIKEYSAHYSDATMLFRDTFKSFLRLGNTVVRSDFIRNVITSQPLNEKNFGLWQPAALFSYFASHKFSAVNISAQTFYFHTSDLTDGSYWIKSAVWQWVERLYAALYYLPEVYGEERADVLEEVENTYGFVRPESLLRVKLTGRLHLRDVRRHGKLIAHVSKTTYKQLVRIALTPKCIAKLMAARPKFFMWRKLINGVSTDNSGDFSVIPEIHKRKGKANVEISK